MRGRFHDLLLRRFARGELGGQPAFAQHRMRSQSVSSSGSSLEVMMIAQPLAAELVDQAIQLGLGADIDAARRIVEQQHLAAGSAASGR